jgi:hypothetical protein
MKCCLWLNGAKVWSARDIKNNFDPASLRGYFLGGSLLRWLRANDGEEEAKKLEETGSIYEAFGVAEPPLMATDKTEMPIAPSDTILVQCADVPASILGSGSGSGGYGLHII